MGEKVIVTKHLEEYVKKLGQNNGFYYGLVVGQLQDANTSLLVHFAKTPVSLHSEEEEGATKESKAENNEIDCQAVMNHVINVTRMVPGSFFVLGIFVVHTDEFLKTKKGMSQVKTCLEDINNVLKQNKLLCGTTQYEDTGKLIISYSSSENKVICKKYQYKSGNFDPVELKFVEKLGKWQLFESNYEIDDIFPLNIKGETLNLENDLMNGLNRINNCIQHCIVFIQNEKVDESMHLEAYLKDKRNKNEEVETLKGSMFFPEKTFLKSDAIIEELEGVSQYSGVITSRIWTNTKVTLRDVQLFIKNDIIRSLAARLQMYLDGLQSHFVTEKILISELPKRVFFPLPNGNGIQFTEYLFRNEKASVAVEQARDILDLDIDEKSILMDFEKFSEIDDVSSTNSLKNADSFNKTHQINSYVYPVAIALALLTLISSILIPFIYR